MPDSIQPVGAMIQPPDPSKGLGMMSSILGIQQQRLGLQQQNQALQTGQYQQQTAQAESSQAQQKNNELQGLAKFTKAASEDPSYMLPDGTADVGKYQKGAMAVAPTYGQPVIGQMSSNFKEAAETRRTLQNLSNDQNTSIANMLTGLASNKDSNRTDLMNGISQLRSTNKDPGYNRALDNLLASFKSDDIAGSAAKAASSLSGIRQTTPSTIDTGAKVVPGTTNTFTGAFSPSGPTVAKGIPPDFELTEDPITHNKYLWNRQTGQTKPFGSGAPAGGGGPTGPAAPPQAPPQRQVGEAEAQSAQVNTNFQNHQANVNASRTANQQLDQIHNVIGLLDSGVKTGQGAQALSQSEQALSQIIPGLGSANSQAAKLDLVNKFLERIGSDYGSLNGSPAKTDAGAESLRQQIGSTGYNPNALRAVMKYTASQYSAAQAKDAGEQQFLSQKGNGILNQDQYEKQWRNSYDPRVFQLANESKDTAKSAIQSMNPADRAGFLKKYAELKAMGAAPQ